MRIIHCADVHLDSKLDTHFTGEQKKQRQAELLDNFADMIEFAAVNDVKAVIIAGDLFDKGKVSQKTVSIISGCIRTNPQIDFFYLRGNHDLEGNLEYLEKECPNLHFFDKSFRVYDIGSCISIYGSENGLEHKEELYRMLEQNRKRFNIVILHGQVVFATTDCYEDININLLRNRGVDYIALGHIHKYTEDRLDERGHWCYSGCLEGRGFDECGSHGFVLLDIDEQSGRYERSFVEMGKRKIIETEIDITECYDSNECVALAAEEALKAGAEHNDMVSIVMTGERDEDNEPDEAYIATRLLREFFKVRIEDRTTVRIDIEKYRNEVSLKGEFVRQVLADSSLDEKMRNAVIRTGFNAFRGDDI